MILMDFLPMIDFYQITKFFEDHSSFLITISTIALVILTAYYAIQTRFLTKNQLRPAFSISLIGQTHNMRLPYVIGLHLKNVGIGAAFNVRVEYSIKGIKNSKQREKIRDIERDMEHSVALIQNGQPLRHDRLADRVIEVTLKYEGISGKYDTKFQLNENEFFSDRL
jgi:hypothetical protein